MTIPAVFNVSEIDGTNGKVLEAAEELVLGDGTFASVGDFNGDGFADFAIGAPALDDSAGKTFIFFGGVDGPELDTFQRAHGDSARRSDISTDIGAVK